MAQRMYFSLPNIVNPMYNEKLTKVIIPPIKNIVRICKQITILIFYQVSSRFVTLLEFVYDPVQVSDISVLMFVWR
jgi:hypothetical protein